MVKSILVTGGAGFIGSNFVPYFAKKYPIYNVIVLDKLTYAANPENLAECKNMRNYQFIHGDICDANLVDAIFTDCDIRGVIHFAAESHVDNSIADPVRFVQTNVMGTAALLDISYKFWEKKGLLDSARFHHISTDEVFGTLSADGFFTEDSPYAPTSPYSASKASADLLVRAYIKTFGMNATISHCSNNYGPWQHAEKFIPTVIGKCLAHEPIPLYGTGLNVRDWLWVEDHCRAVDLIFHQGKPGRNYVISAQHEKTNLDIARAICAIFDELCPWNGHCHQELISFVEDRPGHDFRYASNPERLKRELHWRALGNFYDALRQTVLWYLQEGRHTLKPANPRVLQPQGKRRKILRRF